MSTSVTNKMLEICISFLCEEVSVDTVVMRRTSTLSGGMCNASENIGTNLELFELYHRVMTLSNK